MICGRVQAGIRVRHNFVHEELLVRIGPGRTEGVQKGCLVEQIDCCPVDGRVKHGWSLIRVGEHESLDDIEHNE